MMFHLEPQAPDEWHFDSNSSYLVNDAFNNSAISQLNPPNSLETYDNWNSPSNYEAKYEPPVYQDSQPIHQEIFPQNPAPKRRKLQPEMNKDFEAWTTKEDCHQEYSETLKKVFTYIDMVFVVNFGFISSDVDRAYFIRAKLMYSDDKFIKQPVRRCVLHLEQKKDDQLKEHVLRCDSGEPIYLIDPIDQSCSVKLPVDKQYNGGCPKLQVKYKLMCKNSCHKGMKRFHIHFTLENEQGESYGEQRLNVRSCSAPKRDMMKEESKSGGATSLGATKGIKTEGTPLASKTLPVKRPRLDRKAHIKDIEDFCAELKGVERGEMVSWVYGMLLKQDIKLKENPKQEQLRLRMEEGFKSLELLKPARL